MSEIFLRFLIGGVVVSLFSVLGDLFRPKSFSGLFGAAPSIALASVGLTIHKQGAAFASIEARSMILGAVAFLVYALAVSCLLRRVRPASHTATLSLMPVWFAVSFALLFFFSRIA